MGATEGSRDTDRRIGRRALIVGGTAAAVGSAVLARDELARLWWRAPGVEKPRVEGAVDFRGAAAHYVVRKDGHITQMIRELDVAYHAGNRSYNERSVGIEHEGFVDRPEDFTAEMYAASARLTAGICARYDIPVDREHIIGHVEVPGTDHTDPGKHWDWDRYMKLVRGARSAPAQV